MAAETVQLMYQIAVMGRRDLDLAPDPRTGFEMTLLRMVAFDQLESAATAIAVPAQQAARPVRESPAAPPKPPAGSDAGFSRPDGWRDPRLVGIRCLAEHRRRSPSAGGPLCAGGAVSRSESA